MRRLVVSLVGAVALLISATAPGALAQDDSTTTSAATATIPLSTDTVEVQQDIPYYEGGPTLDAYLPKDGQTARPALVLVHGGGWSSGDKAEFAPFALQAANEQRWAVFDVNYLLAPTDPASWPDELHDIQAAIRFVASNGPRFGIDPQQVVAIGESAGANLLAIISSEGTANPVTGEPIGDNPTLAVPIRAVGLWSPPVDLAGLYAGAGQAPPSCGPDQACDFVWTQGAIAQYLRCDPASCPQSYADASPLTWVSSNTSPSFVANSTEELVPIAQVQQYVAALRNDEVDVQFVELPGTLHAIQYGAQVWPQTVSFLQAQLTRLTTPSTTAAPPPTPAAAPAADSGPVAAVEDDRDLGWLVGLAGAIVVVGLAAALVARRRRRREPDRPTGSPAELSG